MSRRPLHKNPYLWAGVVGIAAVTLIRPLFRHEPPAPPVLRQLPSFQLHDLRGQAFGSAQLRGRVYLLHVFDGGCAAPCDPLWRALARLRDRFAKWRADVALVGIAAGEGAPAQLAALTRRHGVDGRAWTLLGGRDAARLLERGLGVTPGTTAAATYRAVTERWHVALVDRRGRLRGSYRLLGKHGVDEAFHRAMHVLQRRPAR